MKPAQDPELERITLAREEILRAPVVEEKPRELCKIARLYSKKGMPEMAEETLRITLKVLEDVKEENPWKFTNYLCNTAYEMACLGKDGMIIREVLDRAIASLDNVDAYYMERKSEVLSLLKSLSGDKRLQPYLRFRLKNGIPTDSRSRIPFEQTFDFLYSYIFLSPKEITSLNSLVETNAGTLEIARTISSIDERWRQAVALAILSRLFLKDSKAKKVREILSLASKKAKEIEFYWVRDNAYEVISGTFVKAYHKDNQSALLDNAKLMISHIKDTWKQARSYCRIAKVHLEGKRFKQAAQELNYVHSHLLEKIDYRDRTAMSMLLIAEVLEKIDKNRRANKLRKEAFSILDAFDQDKRKESFEEYKKFISLRGHSC